MEKAAREAKVETSWIRPNVDYDRALGAFVEGVMGDDGLIQDVAAFEQRIGVHAASNALGQALLRLTVPGVPDTYQGSELWNQSLVDPDNRRPVDFARRRALLEEMGPTVRGNGALAHALLERWHDGAVKLFVTTVALQVRAERKDVFLRGDYTPLEGSPHLVAFFRAVGEERVVVAVPRLTHRLTNGQATWATGAVWGDARLSLPDGHYRNAFTGAEHEGGRPLPIAELLASFPLALLVPV
jgi:(1->4)-alpha-D-glucan 1-alpha-D-glucosylmutase